MKRIRLDLFEEQANEIEKAISLMGGEEQLVAELKKIVRKMALLLRRAKADPGHPMHDFKWKDSDEFVERLFWAAWKEPETH